MQPPKHHHDPNAKKGDVPLYWFLYWFCLRALAKESRLLLLATVLSLLGWLSPGALAQPLPNVEPGPRMMEPAEEIGHPLPRRRYVDPRFEGRAREMTERAARRVASREPRSRVRVRTSQREMIGPSDSDDPFVEVMPPESRKIAPPGDGETWIDEDYPGPPPGDAPLVEGPYVDGPYTDGYLGDEPCFDECSMECGRCGQCDRCRRESRGGFWDCLSSWCPCASVPISPGLMPYWRNFNTYSGAQAFKGPPDLGQNGNFGFNKGVNWAIPLFEQPSIGMQLGADLAFSDFDGGTGLVNHSRTQIFVTGGLFHRAPCNQGFQGGAVIDYLNDNWYVDMNMVQIRAELGYLWGINEIGLWGAGHLNSDTQIAPANLGVPTVTWQGTDQLNLYYRRNFSFGATYRMWIGLSGTSDVMFGFDATAPLSERLAIQVAQNYLLPTGENGVPKSVRETWGLSMAIVWYPAAKTPNRCFDPFRPLFQVADNSWFFMRTK